MGHKRSMRNRRNKHIKDAIKVEKSISVVQTELQVEDTFIPLTIVKEDSIPIAEKVTETKSNCIIS